MSLASKAASSPWLNSLFALAAGALVTLSLAPFNLWVGAILSCLILVYLLNAVAPRQAFWRGWLFGLGLFGSGASWVYVSIHVHGNTNVPLALVFTALFCAGLALLQAAFAWCYVRFLRRLPAGQVIGFSCLWVLFEWLRSWLLTGFPWLFIGYSQIDTALAGWGPVVGVYGISFVCALTGASIFAALGAKSRALRFAYLLPCLLLWSGGSYLKTVDWATPSEDQPLSVAIYQPNIPQERKWDRAWYIPILEQYQQATDELLGYDILIWPESAIPNFYQRSRSFLDPIASKAATAQTTLISGIPYRADDGKGYYNSIVALGNGQGQYHKQRLVPFGEYLPLEKQLRGLINFFNLPMSSFSPGPSDQSPLRAGSYSIAPFICYEIVYPDLVASNAASADVLVTISNDSWFGASIGPIQHLQMARMRALENGRYLIRGTNNGVSAIIDPTGKIQDQTEQFVETTLRSQVKVYQGTTPFTRFGSMTVIIATALGLILLLLLHNLRPSGQH